MTKLLKYTYTNLKYIRAALVHFSQNQFEFFAPMRTLGILLSSNSLLLKLINTNFDYLRISLMPNHHNTTSSKIRRENGVHTLCLEESSIRNITIVGKSTRGRPHLRLVGPHRTTRHTRTTASISNTTESFWGRRRTWGARLHVNSIVSVGKKIIFVCKWRARPSVSSSGLVHLGGGRGRGGRWGP